MPGNAGRTVPAIPITTKLPAIIHHNASIFLALELSFDYRLLVELASERLDLRLVNCVRFTGERLPGVEIVEMESIVSIMFIMLAIGYFSQNPVNRLEDLLVTLSMGLRIRDSMRVRNGYWFVGRAGRWLDGLKAVRAGAEAQRRGGPGGLRGLGAELEGLVSGAGRGRATGRNRRKWEGGYQRTRLSRSSIACRTIRNTAR
jgi:hypothetical protein